MSGRPRRAFIAAIGNPYTWRQRSPGRCRRHVIHAKTTIPQQPSAIDDRGRRLPHRRPLIVLELGLLVAVMAGVKDNQGVMYAAFPTLGALVLGFPAFFCSHSGG